MVMIRALNSHHCKANGNALFQNAHHYPSNRRGGMRIIICIFLMLLACNSRNSMMLRIGRWNVRSVEWRVQKCKFMSCNGRKLALWLSFTFTLWHLRMPLLVVALGCWCCCYALIGLWRDEMPHILMEWFTSAAFLHHFIPHWKNHYDEQYSGISLQATCLFCSKCTKI